MHAVQNTVNANVLTKQNIKHVSRECETHHCFRYENLIHISSNDYAHDKYINIICILHKGQYVPPKNGLHNAQFTKPFLTLRCSYTYYENYVVEEISRALRGDL